MPLMNLLVEFLIFDISIAGFINFFFGIFTGMIAFTAIYVYLLVRGKNIDVDDIKKPSIDVDVSELEDLIRLKQKKFKGSRKTSGENVGKYTLLLSYELIEEIANYFFPTSKHPLLELSVNETLNLSHYIADRIDLLLEKPILKNTKNIRITKIMEFLEKKKAIEESKIARAAKKLRVGKVVKYGGAVLNALNPVYWFRKLVINTSVDVMTKKVCVVIIGIVGEETAKVYSKKVFESPVDINFVEKELKNIFTEDEGDDIDESFE